MLRTHTGDRMMGFGGLERDTVTGLNMAVFRQENPGTGRWDSQDLLGFAAGDSNLSRYALNDPTTLADPLGLQHVTDVRVLWSDQQPMPGDTGPDFTTPFWVEIDLGPGGRMIDPRWWEWSNRPLSDPGIPGLIPPHTLWPRWWHDRSHSPLVAGPWRGRKPNQTQVVIIDTPGLVGVSPTANVTYDLYIESWICSGEEDMLGPTIGYWKVEIHVQIVVVGGKLKSKTTTSKVTVYSPPF
jgi:RHS repeat-associated protein